MSFEDIITGSARIDEKRWNLTFGYGKPEWKETSIREVEKRDDFLVCSGQYRGVSTGADVLNFTYGPSAGGLPESVKFNIYTYGERVLSITPESWYKDRKIRILQDTPDAAMLKIERYNGILNPFYSSMLAMALEEMTGAEKDNSLDLARIIINEITRISDHIGIIAGLAEGAAQNVAFRYLHLLRERLLRIVSRRFGHRYFFGVNGYRGFSRPVDFHGISDEINTIVGEFNRVWGGLEESRIFTDRIQGTTRINFPWLIGPPARASGMKIDSRAGDQLLPYVDLGFVPCEQNTGDALGRVLVRKDEIANSSEIITLAEKGLSQVPESTNTFPDGTGAEFTIRTETPGGDALMKVVLSDSRLSEIYIRPSSLQNLAAFSEGMKGNLLTDFVFGYWSFGIHISELGGFQ